jgi:hypothetical protein
MQFFWKRDRFQTADQMSCVKPTLSLGNLILHPLIHSLLESILIQDMGGQFNSMR